MTCVRHSPSFGRAALMLLVVLLPAAQAQTGEIKGTVTTSTGTAVPQAFIVATHSGATHNTRSGSDGSFTFSGLAAGTYRVCVQALEGSLLDPCQWSSAPIATVTAGQTVSVGTIQVVGGQRLYVNLLDDVGALSANAGPGKTPGAHILIGVWAGGLFHPLRLRSQNSGGWNLDLVVPVNTALNLTVSSTDFALTDSQGNKVNPSAGASVAVQAVSGTNPAPYVFHVTGFTNNGH